MIELYKAIRAVMGDVGYVQKVGQITDNRGKKMYNFAGEVAMLRALRPSMLERGLCMFPVGCELFETHEILDGKYGKKTSRTVRVVSTYRLAHESGEFVDIQVAGEGQDSGDKAAAKAMTIALKYAIRQTFLIETGDDPDESRPEREFHDERGVLHQPQHDPVALANKALVAYGAKNKSDADALCRVATEQADGSVAVQTVAAMRQSPALAEAVLAGLRKAESDLGSKAEVLAVARRYADGGAS